MKIANNIIGNILGKPRKRGGRNDWDGDGVPNKKDCQPRNIMRQDSIYNHPQIQHRMNNGETYFVKVQEDGYSTTTGPMTLERANEKVQFNEKMGRIATIIQK